MTDDIRAHLADQSWRLANLYKCRREGRGGGEIPFIPRPEQQEVFRHFIETPTVPSYIIKSRRLGLSTGINIFQGDSAMFKSGWRGILIDQKQEDATKKMIEQIRFAVDTAPKAITSRLRFDKRNDSELRFRLNGEEETQDSVIFATTGARGGECSMLHVSEMGPIAAQDPKRAEEIVSGAFPAAREGIRVIETTWMGGKYGELWELVEPILNRDPNAIGKIFFFPWHADPAAISTVGMVTAEIEDYFKDLSSRLGKSFSQDQKRWYAIQKAEQRNKIYREYPSTLDEAFRAPIEGAIYAEEIDKLRTAGRILPFGIDKSALVHTAWDLGAPANTVTWYFQLVAGEIRVIDVDIDLNLTAVERVARMLSKGYPLGLHVLPHDAQSTPTSGKSTADVLREAGLSNIRIAPRTQDVWIGIDSCLELFPRFVFHSENCAAGIARLENYYFKSVSSGGITQSEPVHDRNSHAADALRMIPEAMQAGILPSGIMGSHGVTDSRPRTRAKVVAEYRGNR